MSYNFEFHLTRKQMQTGMLQAGKEVMEKGRNPWSTLISYATQLCVVMGAIMASWAAYIFVTGQSKPPFALLIFAGAAGGLMGWASAQLQMRDLARGVMKSPRMAHGSQLCVSEAGITSSDPGGTISAPWLSVDAVTQVRDCITFTTGGLAFVLPVSEVSDLDAFLTQVDHWRIGTPA